MATFAPLPTLAPITATSDPGLDAAIAATPYSLDSVLYDAYTQPVQTTQSPLTDEYLSTPTIGQTAPNAASAATAASSPAATSSAASSTGVLTSIWNVITGNIENGIFVILGLLLIAAGIFTFKTTETVVKVAGKAATKATEIGAAAAA